MLVELKTKYDVVVTYVSHNRVQWTINQPVGSQQVPTGSQQVPTELQQSPTSSQQVPTVSQVSNKTAQQDSNKTVQSSVEQEYVSVDDIGDTDQESESLLRLRKLASTATTS